MSMPPELPPTVMGFDGFQKYPQGSQQVGIRDTVAPHVNHKRGAGTSTSASTGTSNSTSTSTSASTSTSTSLALQ
jgi:hypothetical protein